MPLYLKQSTASQEVPLGYFVDSTDGNTEETALTINNTDIKIWKSGATTLANKNSGGATHISNGVYYAVLDATDTDTLGSLVIFVHVSGALAVRVECVVLAANIYDSLIGGGDVLDVSVTQWLGTAAATPTVAGVPEVDVTHWLGTAAATPTVAGVPEVDITHLGGVAQSATDLKDFADDGYDPSTNKVQGVVLTDTVTTYTGNTPQTGDAFARLGAPAGASIAADLVVIDNFVDDLEGRLTAARAGYLDNLNIGGAVASQASVDTVDNFLDTEIATILSDLDDIQTRLPAALTTGTSDSGTTTTMVDAARTEADTDYWKGQWIRFTSGNLLGQVRLITGFTPASDTITFAPATTQAVSTHTYEILPAARIDVGLWLSSLPNDLISGRVDSNVQAMANGVITAAVVADGTIDAGAIASDAITAAKIADNALTAAKFASGAFDAVWSVAARTLTAFGFSVTVGTNNDKTGYSLSAAGIQAIWDALTSALSTANSIGKLLVDNINATISSRASQTSVDDVDNFVDTEVAAILAAVDTEVAAIKVVTDALPNAGALTTIQSDLDNIQTRIPAALTAGGNMKSDALALNGSTAAAAQLAKSAATIVSGAAIAGTLSTTQMTTNLTEATDDHYNGRIIIWTSGVLIDQATDITDYDGATKRLTYTAITEAPTAGDTFIIV